MKRVSIYEKWKAGIDVPAFVFTLNRFSDDCFRGFHKSPEAYYLLILLFATTYKRRKATFASGRFPVIRLYFCMISYKNISI